MSTTAAPTPVALGELVKAADEALSAAIHRLEDLLDAVDAEMPEGVERWQLLGFLEDDQCFWKGIPEVAIKLRESLECAPASGDAAILAALRPGKESHHA